MYNQKKNTKFERIRNIQLQTKVKELLENNKKEKDKEKREALEEKTEREKSRVNQKKRSNCLCYQSSAKTYCMYKNSTEGGKSKIKSILSS